MNRHGEKRKLSVDEDRAGKFEPWTDNLIMENQVRGWIRSNLILTNVETRLKPQFNRP